MTNVFARGNVAAFEVVCSDSKISQRIVPLPSSLIAIFELHQTPRQDTDSTGHGEIQFQVVSSIVPATRDDIVGVRRLSPGDAVTFGELTTALCLVKPPAQTKYISIVRLGVFSIGGDGRNSGFSIGRGVVDDDGR